jgi:hypothetical protein
MLSMKTHPHAEATYRIVPLSGETFGVEVLIPGSNPTTVSSFASETEAAEWIERKKNRVVSEMSEKKGFHRAARRW